MLGWSFGSIFELCIKQCVGLGYFVVTSTQFSAWMISKGERLSMLLIV
ncbi:hypothetical protein LINPERHAP2_LOCUS19961 [Linum perenne]